MTRRYKSWEHVHSTGRCRTCRRRGALYKGLCYPCRKPEEVRDLIEVGVPCGTTGALINVVRKCKTAKEAQRILDMIYPIVMENVVVKAGALRLRSQKYRWNRNNGWSE